MNCLDALKQHTTVVADTGDLDAIAQFTPQDATTNPSLILKSATDPRFAHLVEEVAAHHPKHDSERIEKIMDGLLVCYAEKILAMIPGRVSLEVSPALSFDRDATVKKATALMGACVKAGINPERILIKIAATWEGIQAAKQLELAGISCNLTLLFSFAQALACADAGVTLISPFVGRIYDWQCAHEKTVSVPIERDMGVASVARIFQHYKKHQYPTDIMGASFRNTAQILALAGCDLMTISPELLSQLKSTTGEVPRQLMIEATPHPQPAPLSEAQYRYQHNTSAMAVEKLADGIRKFEADALALAQFLHTHP